MSKIAPTGASQKAGKRIQDKKHLKFIACLPCAVCFPKAPVSGVPISQAAHVRYADPENHPSKRAVGMGEKPDDRWAVPLCPHHHLTGAEAQHGENEKVWWEKHGIDPIALAKRLYAVSGDLEEGERVVRG